MIVALPRRAELLRVNGQANRNERVTYVDACCKDGITSIGNFTIKNERERERDR